jgi:hypothetical protein
MTYYSVFPWYSAVNDFTKYRLPEENDQILNIFIVKISNAASVPFNHMEE